MINYFELYDIPLSFHPDQHLVKKKYYELSRKYHPDRFTLASADEQAEVLKMSSINNQAFKTLSNTDSTMAYFLKINDLLEEEEKYSLPPDFLMEMMDLNEQVSELEMDADSEEMLKQAEQALHIQLDLWQQQVNPLLTNFEEDTDNKEILLQIKDFYFRKKYLLRIQERINTFASH